jgi:hypothetical protein
MMLRRRHSGGSGPGRGHGIERTPGLAAGGAAQRMSWELPAGMGDPPVGRKNMIGRAVRRGRGIKGRAA